MQMHVCLPVCGAPGECYYNILLCCDYFSSSSVVLHAFSVLCMYSKFGHHLHPLGYLCAKLRFFATSTAELAHGEKSCTQSLTHPAYLMPQVPKCLRFGLNEMKSKECSSTLQLLSISCHYSKLSRESVYASIHQTQAKQLKFNATQSSRLHGTA